MKKIININFSGRLINIEEDAYTELQNYLESLKKYFSNEEGQEEIIADIENRIAEIFYDKQQKGATCITITDVNEVAKAIGKPEDFEEQPEPQNNNTNYNDTRQFVRREKLYRNSMDKMLGGVCSGVANYFNIDTTVVRLIFAVLVFGAGTGVLLYLILWIVLPQSNQVVASNQRRLYRDENDSMIGGVASGIANYFGIEVWIPRLIFAAPFIFSILHSFSRIAFHDIFSGNQFFSMSFAGTTTVTYFILWWIIPLAKTVQEKMAMKGEKLDLNSIKNNVQDGIKNFGNKAQQFGQQVSDKATEWGKQTNQYSTTFTNRANEAASRVTTVGRTATRTLGHGIGLLIKGFGLFIGGIIAITILLSLFTILLGAGSIWPLKEFVISGFWQTVFAYGTLLFLIIPGIAFIVWLVRRIFKIKRNIKPIKFAMASLFFIGFISAICFAASVLNNFKYNNQTYTTQLADLTTQQPTNGKYKVIVTEPEINYSGEIPWINIDEPGFDITNDTIKYANIKVKVEQSNDSLFHTYLQKYSRGNNKKAANDIANKITFNYSITDSIIDLGSNIAISKNEKFRLQEVIVIIQVPTGKKIIFDESTNKLNPYNFTTTEKWDNGQRVYRRRSRNNDYTFECKVNQTYTMGSNGKLELEGAKQNYTPNNNTDNENNRKIELQKQTNQRKIDSINNENEKLEDKQNAVTYTNDNALLEYENMIILGLIKL